MDVVLLMTFKQVLKSISKSSSLAKMYSVLSATDFLSFPIFGCVSWLRMYSSTHFDWCQEIEIEKAGMARVKEIIGTIYIGCVSKRDARVDLLWTILLVLPGLFSIIIWCQLLYFTILFTVHVGTVDRSR